MKCEVNCLHLTIENVCFIGLLQVEGMVNKFFEVNGVMFPINTKEGDRNCNELEVAGKIVSYTDK